MTWSDLPQIMNMDASLVNHTIFEKSAAPTQGKYGLLLPNKAESDIP
jgi:hypothetical protein